MEELTEGPSKWRSTRGSDEELLNCGQNSYSAYNYIQCSDFVAHWGPDLQGSTLIDMQTCGCHKFVHLKMFL